MIWLAIALTMAAPATSQNICVPERPTILALPYVTFDQNMDAGWRAVAARAECTVEAADLIKQYRERKDAESRSLAWHEGQLRAEAGQSLDAIALMRSTLRPALLWGRSQDDWNSYVRATIAFLRRDRAGLLDARRRLAAYPDPPANYVWIDEEGRQQRGKPVGWPYNLDVVDGLINCFDQPQCEAYSVACRQSRLPKSAIHHPSVEKK